MLVGSKTFGKAVIQTVEALQDESAIVVTIAKYETPKRTDINRKGIFPQVEKQLGLGEGEGYEADRHQSEGHLPAGGEHDTNTT